MIQLCRKAGLSLSQEFKEHCRLLFFTHVLDVLLCYLWLQIQQLAIILKLGLQRVLGDISVGDRLACGVSHTLRDGFLFNAGVS